MGWDRFFRRRERGGGGRPAGQGTPAAGTEAGEPGGPGAGAADLAYSLGQARPDEQRAAALERLIELRAAGKVSEENFLKEKRRLQGEG